MDNETKYSLRNQLISSKNSLKNPTVAVDYFIVLSMNYWMCYLKFRKRILNVVFINFFKMCECFTVSNFHRYLLSKYARVCS